MPQVSAPAHNEADKPIVRTGWIRRTFRKLFPTGNEIRDARYAILLCVLSSLGAGLIFHQNMLGHLAWIVIVPYLIAVHSLQGKMVAWCTVLFGFLWYYISCFWLHTLVVFHWLIPVGVAAGALYYGLYFLLFAFPASWCCRHVKAGLRPWALAVCWVAVEYLRNFTDMAFPWNLLGHSQMPANMPVARLSAVGGVSLVSLVIAVVNAGIAVATVELAAGRGFAKALKAAGIPAGFAAMAMLGGTLPFGGSAEGKNVKVSVVQPGISQLTKWDAMMGQPDDTESTYWQRYQRTDALMYERAVSLSREAGIKDQPKLIVMPESVFLAGNFTYNTPLHQSLWDLSKETKADLFFGADNRMTREDYDKQAVDGQRFLAVDEIPTTNVLPTVPLAVNSDGTTVMLLEKEPPMTSLVAAWHVSPDEGLTPRVYNKMQLVPFGETVPFIGGLDWLRGVLEVSGIAGAFKPGLQNTIFEVDGTRFGAVICFESTFSYLSRRLAQSGAQFICVLTNDAWYDPQYAISEGGFWGTLFKVPGLKQLASAGPRQHFIQSQFRALETALPVVRSANSGISSVINYKGIPSEVLPYSASGYLTEQVLARPIANHTIAVRLGEWVGLLCVGFWLAMFIQPLISRLRTKA